MRLFSPSALSAGLGLALLAAPLAMAQSYQHHAMAPHPMHAPAHHVVSMHNRMVHVQRHIAMPMRHNAMPMRHAPMPPHGNAPHHG
jgi:hypothetical protein